MTTTWAFASFAKEAKEPDAGDAVRQTDQERWKAAFDARLDLRIGSSRPSGVAIPVQQQAVSTV